MILAAFRPRAPLAQPCISRLPDEVLMDVLRLSPPADFAQLRLTSRQFCRVASDLNVQRTAFAPLLLEELGEMRRLRGETFAMSQAQKHRIIAQAEDTLHNEPPHKGRPKDWMQLLQQVRHVQRAVHMQKRAELLRGMFEPSIWPSVSAVAYAGMLMSALLCDQAATTNSPELVGVSAGLALLVLGFLLLSPLLWLCYNLVGLAAEEVATYVRAQLNAILAGPCHSIHTLLQSLT